MAIRSLKVADPTEMSYPGIISIAVTGLLLALSVLMVASGSAVWMFSIVGLVTAFSFPRRLVANRAALLASPFVLRLTDALTGVRQVSGGMTQIAVALIWPASQVLKIDLPGPLGWIQWLGSVVSPILIAYTVYRGGQEAIAHHVDAVQHDAHVMQRVVPLVADAFGVPATVVEKEAAIQVGFSGEIEISGVSGFVPPKILAASLDRAAINRNLAAQHTGLMLSPDSDNRTLVLVPVDAATAAETETIQQTGGLLGAEIIDEPSALAAGSPAPVGGLDIAGDDF